MARARVRLFPQPKQARASNNVQPVFGKVDPFRRQPQAQGTTASAGPLNLGATGGVATTANQIPGDIPPQNIADRMLRAAAGLMPGPTGEPTPTSLDVLKFLQLQQQGTQAPGAPVDPTANLTPEEIEAMQLVGGSLAGNPFISQAGQQRMSQGLLPFFGDIQAAFFGQTDPLLVQQLLAQFQTRGVQPQDVVANIERGRPRGFR